MNRGPRRITFDYRCIAKEIKLGGELSIINEVRLKSSTTGPTETTIRNWLKQADRDDELRSDGPTTEEKEEIRELRKRLRQVKQERDILANRRNSCVAAWFARETKVVPPKSFDS